MPFPLTLPFLSIKGQLMVSMTVLFAGNTVCSTMSVMLMKGNALLMRSPMLVA